MAHRREPILARLLTLAQGVQGIAAAARNVADLKDLTRPGIAIRDGSVQKLTAPRNQRTSAIQLMQMSPEIVIYVGAGQKDQGPLANLFLDRYLAAVLNDTELLSLTTTNGEISFEGASLEAPEPEGREGRMEISLVLVYPFEASAL